MEKAKAMAKETETETEEVADQVGGWPQRGPHAVQIVWLTGS